MAQKSSARNSGGPAFTDDERAAMKERSQELKKDARRGTSKKAADGEADVLAKIAAMDDADRAMAERIHAIVREAAPGLAPKTWYGMPAYARGKDVVVFFQDAGKFKARYSTLGFSDKAALDDGPLWPNSYALSEMTPEAEERIRELIIRAAG
ncbi:iron chaperone [Arthrobacter sp.]|uniref:iron chaperone n=1 Tax=Arthrobacter sp. TaxID=1667 RepID=UPI003A917532